MFPPRIMTLLDALGIDKQSFAQVLEWALTEHLVAELKAMAEGDRKLLNGATALKRFRDELARRTRRRWSHHDVVLLFERLERELGGPYHRQAIPYEEILRLLAEERLECVRCHRSPPDVTLHVDHRLPVSRGGSSVRDNLQFLCAEHNLQKSNKMEVEEPWLDLK